MPNNTLFNFLAPLYESVIQPPQAKQLGDVLALSPELTLLDVGGGTGRVSAALRPYVNQLVLVDLSLPMLRQAQKKNHALLAQASALRLPLADGSVERILVVDAVHHFHQPQQTLAELIRVLRPGGRLVIEEPDIASFSVKLVALLETLALMDSHFLPPAEIARLLDGGGLTVSIQYPNRHTAWVIAEKA